MALKMCTFNCKGFNILKIKHFEHLLKECDILLVQETWALKDQVGRLNRHFNDYNTCGFSGINDEVLLKGKPYGGVSFLYKKSLSPYVHVCELSSNRACCIRLSTSVGYIYIFNVYMPCDSTTNANLDDYNDVLSVISHFCATHNVVNCVIGGDLNTDVSRIRSGNTISLHNYMDKENLFLAINEVRNTVKFTYKGINNSVSLIDHFIMTENMCLLTKNYYTMDSVDNLSDHVQVFMILNCSVKTVPIESDKVFSRSPLWGIASSYDIQQYQLELDNIIQYCYPTTDMLLCDNGNSLCLKREYVSKFHDAIMNATHLAMVKHILHTGKPKLNVIPGWDIEMGCARQTSLFWHDIWNECGREKFGIVYDIMKMCRSKYHYKLRALRKKKHVKTKLSVSKSMLRNHPTTYWKSTSAIRKNKYNTTQMVDGVCGDSNIANLFRRKYQSLYNSVKSLDEEMIELSESIKSAIAKECDCAETVKERSHCHDIDNSDVSKAVAKLKTDKISDNGLVYSNNFIYGTNLLHKCSSILFASMVRHNFAPQTFICAKIIPIPKGSKPALTCSDKYRSIAISNVIGKILDHVIIDRQSDCLKTCNYQFGFKPKASTVLCSTMVNETIQYYTENGGNPVYLLLLDATKAFDKVSYKVLFDVLLDKKVCPRIVNLLYYMYSNQQCHVKWGDAASDSFGISNGVKQGGVISPLLFSLYIDELFLLLKESGMGCHVGLTYAGAFGYADDIALVVLSLSILKQMIQICEQFAESHSITFNPSKTKLLCFNMKLESKVPPIYLNGERVSIVENEKHLGNYVSTDIEDRNIIADVCDLYQRSNLLISDFRAYDSITLDSLHKIYCMHMYGSELWNLNCRYVDEFKVAWRKVKRRIWRLPSNTHNVIIQNLTYNIDDQLDARMAKFIHICLNHDNDVCRSISLSKLLCKNSTFASNYSYLSCKYNLSHCVIHYQMMMFVSLLI